MGQKPLVDDGRLCPSHKKHLVILNGYAIVPMNKVGSEVGREFIIQVATPIDEVEFDKASRGPVRSVQFFPHFLHPL